MEFLLRQSSITGKLLSQRRSFSASLFSALFLAPHSSSPAMGIVVGFHTCEKFRETFGLDQSWLSQALFESFFLLPPAGCQEEAPTETGPTDSNQGPKTNFSPLQPSLGEDSCWAFLTLVNKSCLVCFTKEPQVF